ncbi:S41 family peptidase [Terricaulis sp.]|uniref:S41 family peptidase n=1 Tax=Terricaulis sp. TaxID=2768686 RepID=UPI0037832183
MTKLNLRALAAAAALLLAPHAIAQEAPSRPTTPEGWRALAVADLAATREVLQTQTPIPYDTENPRYPQWLENGYAPALARAESAEDQAGYFYAIASYVNGFGDPHINVSATGELPAALWPGFVAASRNGGAVVVMRDETDAEAPPLGAQILGCEGRPLADLAAERVYPFALNPRLAVDRRRVVTRLFIDRGIPGAPGPRACRISVNGAERDITLRWRALPQPSEPYWTAYQAASLGPATEWGVSEPAPGVYWIGIPTFASGEDTAPHLATLLTDIQSQAAAMRQARAIVIDVRGNGGGNSQWADRIAAAIFGDAVASRAARASSRRSAIEWRASEENAQYWEQWITDVGVREFGENSEPVNELRRVVAGLRANISADPPIWRQGPRRTARSGGITTRRPRGAGPFPARVYMLSNGTCGSSCLNFADTVLFVPGVRLIGSDTGADGPYMEVRQVTLPSGLARLTIPQKVWRGMARGALEAYAADVAYDGAWDDASVRAWTMALIARETAQ